MKATMNLTFASSLTDICEVNSSFDSGVLWIAYHGLNRNKSFISKETFEKCIQTIYNCPIVTHYDRDTDSLGGHDIEVVRHQDDVDIVNITTPVGCIPESSRVWWETLTEDDGNVHEYLCADVLLWKRQEPYRKLKEDGVTAHSMEINVLDGELKDGVFYIYDFEFTAFALIGVEPCFEGSRLELFSKDTFKAEYLEMMQELKEYGKTVGTPDGDNDTHLQNLTEGGEKVLEENLIFENDQTMEPEIEQEPVTDAPDAAEDYALNSNVIEEIYRALSAEKVMREWGESCRYYYVDCDLEAGEVYCWDSEDWLLYGFTFAMDGDAIVIDFESKKRKKYVIADFDEGEQASPFAEVFTAMNQSYSELAQWKAEHQGDADLMLQMKDELESLRQFKSDVEKESAAKARESVFEQFRDLDNTEEFEALKLDETIEIDALTEKCYAIRGKQMKPATFSVSEQAAPKLIVGGNDEADSTDDEPYGGLFVKYARK